MGLATHLKLTLKKKKTYFIFHTIIHSSRQLLRKGRIEDSDSEDERQPPSKRIKLQSPSSSVSPEDNILSQDYEEEPVDLIDRYLDTLQSMYQDIDRMVSFSFVYLLFFGGNVFFILLKIAMENLNNISEPPVLAK